MGTYNSVKEALDAIRSKRLDQNFIRVAIIFLSPVTEKYECRVAYFHERVEAIIWMNSITSEYDKLGIQSSAYVSIRR